MSSEEETRVDVPAAVADRDLGDTVITGSRSTTGPSFQSLPGAIHDTQTSGAEAMRREEAHRMIALTRVMRWLSIAMLATLPFFGGSSLLRWLLVAGIALGIPMGFWFEHILKQPGGLTSRRMSATAVGLGVNAYVGILYFGAFSGATTLVVLALFVASRTEFIGSSFLLYLMCAVAQGLVGGLIIFGAVEDPGLVQLVDVTRYEAVIMLVLVEGMFLAAYLLGHASRKMTLDALEEVEGARRQVGQRDALLEEARQDLDRALQIGGPGRYTERQVGSFKVGVVIGRGAMAEVYEAHHVQTGEPAALKLLHQNLLSEPRSVGRFIREARAASALDTPHVARVIEASDPMDVLPYLAMERLHGNDLAHYLRRKPIMAMSRVLGLVEQVATVIDQAGAAGIVHRDLKPQNLFLAELPDGKSIWKVLDFGVSFLSEGSGTLTQGHVVGTPSYMAPEQARGADVDVRADIHALAAITYRCLTGRPPFVGRDVPAVLYSAVHSMPARPSLVAEVPEAVDVVLAIGLAKKREHRFGTAADFVDALARAARGESSALLIERAAVALGEKPWGSGG